MSLHPQAAFPIPTETERVARTAFPKGTLCLHLLQICLVYVNTLMIQQVLKEPEWRNRLTAADWRGLTPLFFTHINPYGTFKLDMNTRLPIEPHRQGPGQETLQLHLYDENAG